MCVCVCLFFLRGAFFSVFLFFCGGVFGRGSKGIMVVVQLDGLDQVCCFFLVKVVFVCVL